jgi:GNAT superfamily N-acetyltransferase
MKIVPAQSKHAEDIAQLLLFAMGDIVARFIKNHDPDACFSFMSNMVLTPNSQYSLENCWVAEVEDRVAGVICLYPGAELHTLRKPVIQYVENLTSKAFRPEDETEAGEIYIDCVAVYPSYRGKGIASSLINYAKGEWPGLPLGLLVEKPDAKRLYEKLGFKTVGIKYLTGKPLEHMQLY